MKNFGEHPGNIRINNYSKEDFGENPGDIEPYSNI